jgi:hypothetical protein
MPKYHIEIPYTGKLTVEINTNSEEEALEMIYSTDKSELEILDNVDFTEVEEEYHKIIVEGNIFYGVLNKRKIEIIQDEN